MNKQTQKVIKEMLTENTGRHMLDSGGAQGRHWQRNQGRDFEAEPETLAEFSIWKPQDHEPKIEIQITHNLYHWMAEKLEYNERVDSIFHKYANRKSQVDLHWPTNIENFTKYFNASSIHGTKPMGANTYNGECLLSQDLQYTQFSTDFGDLVAIQIHNGADARGGYTKPRIFDCDESFFYYTDATLWAANTLDPNQTIMPFGIEDNSHSWHTDDGYHFYGNDCKDLGTYNATDDPQLRGKGHIFVEDGDAYSPINGAILEATA